MFKMKGDFKSNKKKESLMQGNPQKTNSKSVSKDLAGQERGITYSSAEKRDCLARVLYPSQLSFEMRVR